MVHGPGTRTDAPGGPRPRRGARDREESPLRPDPRPLRGTPGRDGMGSVGERRPPGESGGVSRRNRKALLEKKRRTFGSDLTGNRSGPGSGVRQGKIHQVTDDTGPGLPAVVDVVAVGVSGRGRQDGQEESPGEDTEDGPESSRPCVSFRRAEGPCVHSGSLSGFGQDGSPGFPRLRAGSPSPVRPGLAVPWVRTGSHLPGPPPEKKNPSSKRKVPGTIIVSGFSGERMPSTATEARSPELRSLLPCTGWPGGWRTSVGARARPSASAPARSPPVREGPPRPGEGRWPGREGPPE